MKFAKTLERELRRDIPEEWVEAAIQYKALKKCINKVVDELQFLGLEQNKLKLLLNDKVVDVGSKNDATNAPNPIIAEYTLTKVSPGSHLVKPILKITLDFSNENLSDDSITKTCNEVKQKIESLLGVGDSSSGDEEKIVELIEDGGELKLVSSREGSLSPPVQPTSPPLPVSSMAETENEVKNVIDKLVLSDTSHKKREIYIVLNSDGKFFQMLEEELEALEDLTKNEESKIMDEVKAIAGLVTNFTDKRSELYKWRELFKIYLDSEVYFRYNDQDREPRNEEDIKLHLEQFLKNVDKSGILTQFKKKNSIAAFNQFVAMNFHLLKMMEFQTINTEAIRKILKKFDKQTSLGIQNIYSKLILPDFIFVGGKSLAQSICYVIQDSVLSLVPQIDDYSCPIFKMKQEDKTSCPMCRRKGAILEADSSNLDLKSMELMKKYFPVEVREKIRDRDKERYNEIIGSSDKCAIM
ncbi:hypothetical protein KGF56_003906 [Candida oxycetoniae]|uniref:SPX domain-containing protein n=1 Tax=Candida oxycetoniae TaxID=497107 RepID=A0AAI9SUK9_9ASCO|nr:uncharacterized protein KGF56_003906 [Candida oxycetoniae]KAI3403318.2 hypothetical protein KGF56_003906 [Candida oxycetoniae]